MTLSILFRQMFAVAALALGVLGSGQATAQSSLSPRPAIWVVRDADSTIYLFGTIHFMRPDTDWRTDETAAALVASQTLVLEVANPDDQAAVIPLIQQYGRSPERPLSTLLSAEEFRSFDIAARRLGGSGAQMDTLRPWLAGVMLSAAIPARGGFDPASGVDLVLRAEANRLRLRVTGLETPADQVRMLSGFPEAGQLAFLRNTLETFDQAPTELGLLADAWTRGDVEAIARVTLEPMRARSPAVYAAVIIERNHRWADQISRMLNGSGTTFVAVGALHLAGDDSVQNILPVRWPFVALSLRGQPRQSSLARP